MSVTAFLIGSLLDKFVGLVINYFYCFINGPNYQNHATLTSFDWSPRISVGWINLAHLWRNIFREEWLDVITQSLFSNTF